MNDHKKLIEEARARTIEHARQNPEGSVDITLRLADALEAAEKAHTPTDDEREVLSEQIAYRVQTAVAYGKGVQKWGQLSQKTQDAWIAEQVTLTMNSRAVVGFRRFEAPEQSAALQHVRLYCENQGDKFRHHAGRILAMLSEVPEPSAEEWREGERSVADAMHYVANAEPQGEPNVSGSVERFQSSGEMKAQGEPSDAQVDAAWCGWNSTVGSDRMRAALRAAMKEER